MDTTEAEEESTGGADDADCIPGTRYSKYFIIHLVKELCEHYSSTPQPPPSTPPTEPAEELADRLDVLSQMAHSSPSVAQFLLSEELHPAILFLVQAVSTGPMEGDEQGIRLARPLFAILRKLADALGDGERDDEMVSALLEAAVTALRWMDARVMVECMKILARVVGEGLYEGDGEATGMLQERLADEDFIQ